MDGDLNRSKLSANDEAWMSQFDFEPHLHASFFPDMNETDFAELLADIREHGLKQPILLYDGKILDGRHRYKACRQLGISYRFETYTGDKPLIEVISLNLKRRHLSNAERAMMAAKVSNLTQGQKADTANAVSQEQAASMFKVSADSLQRAKRVIDNGIPEIKEAVWADQISVSKAAEVAALPYKEQKRFVKQLRQGVESRTPPKTNTELFGKEPPDSGCISTDSFEFITETAVEAITTLDKIMSDAIWSLAPSNRKLVTQILLRYRQQVDELVSHFREQLRQLPGISPDVEEET